LWLLGEVLANILVDFFGLVIDIVVAFFGRKRPPQSPVSGTPTAGAGFRQALAARRARRSEQQPPRER
jgi:hypothetical protein